MTEIERGSDWRKWDLHFHTPSSYDYADQSVTNEEIIDILDANGISVVAITDHHQIDIQRIQELQTLGRDKNIVVLPGIEFLSDARGKEPIHFIGIFSEHSNLEYIWGQIANRTNIKKIQGERKKHNDVYCDLKDTIELVKELGGIITIHAGQKGNSIENITNSLPQTRAQKTDIASIVDIYELGKADDKNGYIEHVFPAIGRHMPMIICSDNHNIRKYVLKENCWIKADCTFEGLKQAIFEPKERVRIQARKPHEKPGYQVIDSVDIYHKDFYLQKIFFNQNLNTIIGGRSTGKSILLGAIARKLSCNKEVKIDNAEYKEFVEEVAANLTITWKDNIVENNRDIEYFPQSYMYHLAQNSKSELDMLVEGIIRQNDTKNELISNYELFSSENNTSIISEINKLFQMKESLTEGKKLLKEKGDTTGISSEIAKLEKESDSLKEKINISTSELDQFYEHKKEIDGLIRDNEVLRSQINKISLLKVKSLINENLDTDLVAFNESNKSQIKMKFDELKLKLEQEWGEGLEQISQKNSNLLSINSEKILLIESNPIYIKGGDALNTNKHYQAIEEALKIQKDKLFKINQINEENIRIESQIKTLIDSIKVLHKQYYEKIEAIKNDLSVTEENLKIEASAGINIQSYRELLGSVINQQSSQGQMIVDKNIDSIDDFFESSNDLFDKLCDHTVILKGSNTYIGLAQKILSTNFFRISYDIVYDDDVFRKMSEGKKAFVVLMLLLDFSTKDCPILIDQPEDDLDNRAIYKDLVKYLKRKKKERQIIVVTHNPNIVVGADSELVIVANQNGTDTLNKNNSKFQYISGSLENTSSKEDNANNITCILESQGIQEHVCEVLEGGSEAFKQREKRYSLK